MKTRVNPFLIASVLIIQSVFIFSQQQTDLSSLTTGRTYKFVLFDDTEIFGKLLSADSLNIKVVTSNKSTIIIPKSNILYYTTELSESKYRFSLGLLGGMSFFTNNAFSYYSPNNAKGPHFDIEGTMYLSDSKAVKFDAGYTYLKANNDNYGQYTYGEYPSTLTGGNVSIFTFKGNLLLGRFKPEEKMILYFSVGFGLCSNHQDETTESYYSQNYQDTSYTHYIYKNPAVDNVSALLSVGGAMGYRFTKHFGFKLEMEYDMMTYQSIFIFWGDKNYFPVRAGIFYMF